ncbi:TMV resistance protein N-like isoform X1 [Quercus robur]|uniref:TMV resistance protein N-like isoform X1 n=1 Tax=Quercus robur TaxID=38942 RepID=UPI002162C538|nr:TMV resistance protein N-like isoform X1 [Quercus robur]
MASMCTQKACTSFSSSSSSNPLWKYDVFLSFYGEDTRKNFTDHLYATLKQKGINTYRDNENLEQGKPIASGLMKAIEESKYAIIVLSKNYAFSKWFLNELVKILECMKDKELKVLPVFYHVNPSDVGNQRETFGKACLKHEEDRKVSIEQIQKWRTALKEVSKIRGWHLLDSHESEDIQEITKNIFDELNHEIPNDHEHLFGINSRVKEMMNLFSTMSDAVHFIGIWGMPGIGKTTLALAIYGRICHQFEASCLIHDVRETVEKEKAGLVNLQKQLLFKTLKVKEENIWDYHEGIKVIKTRLSNKKVLIVIDDVDKVEQLQALAGSCDWFGLGSRIIITSKDKHLLIRHHRDTIVHRANGLDNDEALELFSWIVFNQTYPKKDFEDLSNGFVKYANGLPIALKVISSSLIDRPREVWEDYLHQLEEIPEGEILDKLEISYRGLNEIEQNLFLDIACFFKGEDKNRVAHIEGFGCEKNIKTLEDKSLIAILGGKLWLHDLIQEMGWRIVRRESPQEPGRHSRLWFCKDVFHVLKENTGTEVVEGIVLDFQGTEVVEGMVLNSPPRKENLNDKAFLYMKSLRLLKISNVHLPTGLNFLSNKLRMMEWHDYPLKFMPISFQPDNLVELIMPRSHIEELPEGLTQNLAKLRLLDLSDSKVLVKTPNFIGCPNLERLIFQGCTSLYELHPSVGALNKLTLLNLKDCRSLTGLPCEINLKSLKIFILSGCSSLKKFSEIGTNMTSLSELYLDGIAVEELPSSLERLTGMTVLSLQGCKNLSSFPSVNLPSLKTLNLSGFKVQPPKSWLSHGFSLVRAARAFFQGCFPIREAINLLLPRLRFIASLNLADRNLWDGGLPDDLSGLSSLQELDLSKNNFTRLPDSISQLSKLNSLALNDCSRLQSLPDLPLSVGYVRARRCPLLEKYSNQDVAWTSGETGFTMVVCDNKEDDQIALIRIPILPYDDFDPSLERFVEGEIQQNKCFCDFSNSTETPEWFSHQSPGSSVTIPLPSDLRDDSSWIGIALFTSVVILENLNNVSSAQDDEVSIDFICRSDIIEVSRINCLLNVTGYLPVPLFHASSFGLKILIPAGILKDHLKDCSCIRAFIRSKCTYFEIKTCGARVLYEQDLVKVIRASGKM